MTRDGSRALAKAKTAVIKEEHKLFSKLKLKQEKFCECLEIIAAD
jgi:hypothetical protein